MSTDTETVHGTYAGEAWHRRHDIPVCQPCKDARRDYQAEWRKTNLEGRQRERESTKATGRAMRRLANLHPVMFRAIYEEELRKIRGPQ
jgi:hypothetical protein